MDKTDLYWQRRLGEIERRVERLEAEIRAVPLNAGDFYTVDQFAKALCVRPITIRRRIKQGMIDAVKVGKTWRIPRSELKEIFE